MNKINILAIFDYLMQLCMEPLEIADEPTKQNSIITINHYIIHCFCYFDFVMSNKFVPSMMIVKSFKIWLMLQTNRWSSACDDVILWRLLQIQPKKKHVNKRIS